MYVEYTEPHRVCGGVLSFESVSKLTAQRRPHGVPLRIESYIGLMECH